MMENPLSKSLLKKVGNTYIKEKTSLNSAILSMPTVSLNFSPILSG